MRPLENIRLCSCLYLVHKSQNYKNNTYEVLPQQRRCMCSRDSEDGNDLVDHFMQTFISYHNNYLGLLCVS